jgi:xylan 1,4-beta-xylosidase
LYNYEHFNHLFATGKKFDVTYTKRYTAFSELGKMSATLELSDIPAKSCKIKEHILNQKYGSAFDEWVRMGAPKLDSDSIDYLKQICVPKLVVREQTFEGGKLLITAALAPLEVRLIQIEY